jgi:hypothetical protein
MLVYTSATKDENTLFRPLTCADTSPPAPLLQERGMERNLGVIPQTPTREAQPLWTLRYFQRGFHKGRPPQVDGRSLGLLPSLPIPPRRGAGHILPGVWGCPPTLSKSPQEWGIKGAERAIFGVIA